MRSATTAAATTTSTSVARAGADNAYPKDLPALLKQADAAIAAASAPTAPPARHSLSAASSSSPSSSSSSSSASSHSSGDFDVSRYTPSVAYAMDSPLSADAAREWAVQQTLRDIPYQTSFPCEEFMHSSLIRRSAITLLCSTLLCSTLLFLFSALLYSTLLYCLFCQTTLFVFCVRMCL